MQVVYHLITACPAHKELESLHQLSHSMTHQESNDCMPFAGIVELEPSMTWNPQIVAGIGAVVDPTQLHKDMHGYLAGGYRVSSQAQSTHVRSSKQVDVLAELPVTQRVVLLLQNNASVLTLGMYICSVVSKDLYWYKSSSSPFSQSKKIRSRRTRLAGHI